MVKAIIIGLVITVVGLFALAAVNKAAKDMDSSSVNGYPTSEVIEENTMKVSISGEINHPGDYYVLATGTLGDLIIDAGGVTSKADRKAYNEGLVIGTHTSFYIPSVSELPATCIEQTIVKVNVNTANETELKGIDFTAAQATNLITYRTDNGSFQVLEDIMLVKGIGQATFNKVKNHITLS